MSRLLVVHHAPTPTVEALLAAVLEGSANPDLAGVEVVALRALEPDPASVLAADAIVMVTPANFGYMSGALKHFLDSVFLHVGGALSSDGSAATSASGKLPYGLLVHGRYDTHGAVRSVQSIVQALPWIQSAEVVEVLGDVKDSDLDHARELGATLAALIS